MDPEMPFVMIMAVVFMGIAGGVTINALNVLKGYLDKKLRIEELRAQSSQTALQETLHQARAEIGRLQQSSNDVILSFDSTLQRLETRVQSLERIALASGASSASLAATTTRTTTVPAVSSNHVDPPASPALEDGSPRER
jgi:hypothetical protein